MPPNSAASRPAGGNNLRRAPSGFAALALNTLVPGAGVISLGETLNGLLLGLSFTLLCNWWIWATWILPDEFAPGARILLGACTALIYLAVQLAAARVLRRNAAGRATEARRRALSTSKRLLAQDDPRGAWTALLPVVHHADHDVLIAYRAAQVLTAAGDATRARRAWERVRALDRHHVYRAQIAQGTAALGDLSAVAGELRAVRRNLPV